jgi:hypothetical protein
LIGVPLVDTRGWEAGPPIDDPAPFLVFADESSLLIRLSHEEAARSIEAGSLKFGVADDASLVWILARNQNPEELAAMIE